MPVQARPKYPDAGTRPSGGAPLAPSLGLFLVGLLLSCVGGCGLWDDVTSKEFSPKDFFVKPDPLKVLQDSTDGDHRQKALRRLEEPKQHGGSDKDQDAIVQLLCTAAVQENYAICRLAAIQTLAHFKDPRIVEGLKQAYYHASGTFPPETVHMLKCAALKALGDTGQPAAVQTLVDALSQPLADGLTPNDQQPIMNERVTAARSLGRFHHYQATEALLLVLQKDKDPAVRNRAHESLCSATGKDFPPDAQVWAEFLHAPRDQRNEDDGPLHRFVNWWTPAPSQPPQPPQPPRQNQQ